MPIVNSILPDFSPQVAIALWRIEESEEQLLALCREADIPTLSLLSGLSHSKRRIECMAEHLLIHSLIGSDYRLLHNENGMPLLDGSNLCISISHTKHYVVVALSKHTIGIDIEMCQPKILRVRSRFLSEAEQSAISPDSLPLNTAAWTAKEALYKAIGVSGIDFANDVTINAPQLVASPEAYTCRFANRHFLLHTIYEAEFAFTLAVENKE